MTVRWPGGSYSRRTLETEWHTCRSCNALCQRPTGRQLALCPECVELHGVSNYYGYGKLRSNGRVGVDLRKKPETAQPKRAAADIRDEHEAFRARPSGTYTPTTSPTLRRIESPRPWQRDLEDQAARNTVKARRHIIGQGNYGDIACFCSDPNSDHSDVLASMTTGRKGLEAMKRANREVQETVARIRREIDAELTNKEIAHDIAVAEGRYPPYNNPGQGD